MDWSTIESALSQGLAFISELAPAAAMGGPLAGSIGAVVGKVASFANAALVQAQDAQAVITSQDLAAIETHVTAIRAVNDQLAAQISAS